MEVEVSMDPDANWVEQEATTDKERLAELVEALMVWLGRGGFKPRMWDEDPLAESRFYARAEEVYLKSVRRDRLKSR
jgi:hypothetical protein